MNDSGQPAPASPFTLVRHPSDSSIPVGWFDESIQHTSMVFDELRRRVALPAARSISLIIADDIAASVRTFDDEAVGVESLDEFTVDRLGGAVVGKTVFRNDAHTEIVVVMDADLFAGRDGQSQAFAIYLTAHELAHGFIGQLRSLGNEPMEPAILPWLVSRWLVRHALEEYLADRLAEVVLGLSATATNEDGSAVPLSSRAIVPRGHEFVDACRHRLDEMIRAIEMYRFDADLDSMWSFVQESTGELLISLAHAQAEEDHAPGDRVTEPVTSVAPDGFGPLHAMWASLHPLFSAFRILQPAKGFTESEQQLLDEAAELVVQFWEAIGLTFTPIDDTFHIAVAPPLSAWAPAVAENE